VQQHTWRKASFSGQNAQCVTIRNDLSAMRDSKNPLGPVMLFDRAAMMSLVQHVR
jgi:hypothetical protein